MKRFFILLSASYFLAINIAVAEPGSRALNTYSDHESTGMELVAPEISYIEIPAYNLVSVTVVRTSGTCELRVKAGTGYRPGPAEWLPVISDVQAQMASVVEKANVTVLAPSSETRRVYVATESVGKGHCGYRSYIKQADLPSAAGRAFAKVIVQMLIQSVISEITGIEPGDLANNPVAARGVQAAITLFTADNFTDFTLSMMMSEIQRRVTREIPGNPAIASWVVNTFQDIAVDLYGPYFQAQMN